MSLLLIALGLLWTHIQVSDNISINKIEVDNYFLFLDLNIINTNDFSICVPRSQLPVDIMERPILVVKKNENVLYYQQGIKVQEYPMWIALPPNTETAFSFGVDTSFYSGASGEVSAYVQIAGLPCNQAMERRIASAPLPYYAGVVDQETERQAELALGYIFIRSAEFYLDLP